MAFAPEPCNRMMQTGGNELKKILFRYPFTAILCFGTALVLCISISAVNATSLTWDESIDEPYIEKYRVYYYEGSKLKGEGEPGSNYVECPSDENDLGSCPEATRTILEFSIDYTAHYYIVRSVDTRGFESEDSNEAPFRGGDLNRSYNIDLADAILALRLLAGESPNTLEADFGRVTDIDGDGRTGIAEAIYIMGVIVGNY